MKKLYSLFDSPYFLVASALFLQLVATHEVYAQSKKKKQVVVAPMPTKMQAPSYQLQLANQGTTLYRIVIPVHATEHEHTAAEVLQKYILQISGAALPILKSDQGVSPFEILIGQNERLNELDRAIDLNGLKRAGFHLLTDQTRLIIAGGLEKGSLYGVYTFLENYLHCRLYSPGVKIIPKQTQVVLPAIDDRQVPVIDFRDTHYKVTWDKEYIDWHKLNHDEQGGRSAWGSWVHTFNDLLPPEIYYKDHPEYFAEVKGKRITTQPCLSNPVVLEIVNQNLRKKIAENPSARYWSVSQNDNRDYCTCDQCRKIDEGEGSPSGSIIRFVNAVAAQFPDKLISTLAYEYGRHAPKTLIPADNVNIMLCSIEALRHKPIVEDSANMDFVKDLEDWGKIAKDIIIWDYVIQFPNLLAPFPNFHVLQPNIQLFVKNGVNAMFEQGNREVGGEFAALRAYLISKLLWDPNLSVDSLMEDFLNGYYGAAAIPIKRYIQKMEAALKLSGKPLRIFGSPIEAAQSYLTPDLIKLYNSLFDEAEMAVRDSAALLERVRIARLPIQFTMMEQAKKNWTGDQGLFVKQGNRWEISTPIRAMIDPFTDLCIREGVTRVKEWSTSPEEYRASMYRLFSKGMNEHLAFGKPVYILSPDSMMISETQKIMLTDGIRGGHDYAYNWMTTTGKDLEVIIDLEEIKSVHRIESAYFQYAFWLRILPVRVEYATSVDGVRFESVGVIENTLPIDQYGGQQRDFISEFDTRKARYIKVKAVSLGNTPGWHPGAGRPANMSIDEIVVE